MGISCFTFKTMFSNSLVIHKPFTIADCECVKAPLDKGFFSIFVATAAFIVQIARKKKGVILVFGLRELQNDVFISLNKQILENGLILNIVES